MTAKATAATSPSASKTPAETATKPATKATPKATAKPPGLPARQRAKPAAAATHPTQAVQPAPAPASEPASAAAEAASSKHVKKILKPRPVLVRDSFTMTEDDFALIAKLKTAALGANRAAKKSELLRAGLRLLAGMDAESLAVALDRLQTVKTGRPKKGH